jgi:aerobic-type carbon monoxide dehydrogenase small subunit (CoxS/CutS family)
MNKMKLHLFVNNDEIYTEVDLDKSLLWLLREHLELTGTKEGCGAGECGACTVILNGKAVNSCMINVQEVVDGHVITIEGETKNGNLSYLQKSFLANNGMKCGFCTSGMIMAARALLMHNSNPTKEEILEALKENLCSCTTYENIVDIVNAAIKENEAFKAY